MKTLCRSREISFATTKFPPRRQDGRTTGGRSLVRAASISRCKQWPVPAAPRAQDTARQIPRHGFGRRLCFAKGGRIAAAPGKYLVLPVWRPARHFVKAAGRNGRTRRKEPISGECHFGASASDIAAARRSSSKKWAARKSARSGTWPRNFPGFCPECILRTCRRACWPKQAATAFISAGIAAYCSVRSAWLPPVWTENRHRP